MVRGDRQISRSEETGGSVEIRDTGGFSRGMRVRGSGGQGGNRGGQRKHVLIEPMADL